ncbi:pyridoxamine 5'-phosphate oxidase family protein [Maritimibacter sp. DP1N21-5]|uniref:pyridoxamine 5'-phosphate oxidase family protein n=1 Tax=Maritimibacter sp. DP1N21-5 TaxID=2836867 RepID=UPI001C46A246|nr:pyridoxamine 5'-phosphate oxidase family protein [Maritimibacter sp. DP1N21-5]MBV7408384.1 pyridoxamine 5'-phosphate oxidase family protein [Maritimibacter sp. DP1N21-5]
MRRIEDIASLEAIYDTAKPSDAAIRKVTAHLTPAYRRWIEASRFCVVSTAGPEGTDTSPRGNDGPVVRIVDPVTLVLPDWRGNKRLDTLRNIVRDGRISVMFFVPGSGNVVRVNGQAMVTDDAALCASFEQQGKHPQTCTVISVTEVYAQCARAIMRAGLWSGADESAGLPTMGEMLRDATKGEVDGEGYDLDWAARAKDTMW